MNASDTDIIDAVVGGDVDRYAEIVSRYQKAAWKLAYGFVRNMEDAKDVSQMAFVKAYRNLLRFRRGSKFSTWLFRIIVNESKDYLRRKVRQPMPMTGVSSPDADEPVLFEVTDPSGGPDDAAANQELAGNLSKAIDGLPVKQREAFILHHVHGLELKEVSEVMGCRLGTVKAHVFRACETLRIRLAPLLKLEVGQ